MPRVLNRRTDFVTPDAVYIGRPSKWGNPFLVAPKGLFPDRHTAHRRAVEKYRGMLLHNPELIEEVIRELRGKDLVCWCAPLPCHGDVLLELANEEMKL